MLLTLHTHNQYGRLIPLTHGWPTGHIGNLSSALTVAAVVKSPTLCILDLWSPALVQMFLSWILHSIERIYLKHHFMSTETIPCNVKWLKRERNLTCSSARKKTWNTYSGSAFPPRPVKTILVQLFAEHFMSSTYVTVRPKRCMWTSCSCGVNPACECDFLCGSSRHFVPLDARVHWCIPW